MHLFKAASVLLTLATAIYAQASSSKYDFDLTLSEYEDRAASLASTHRVSNIHGYVSGGKTLYTATWEPIPADAIDRIVYVGLTKDEWYYHSSWNISGYHVLVQNIFANEATEDRYNIICEKMPNSGPKRRYTTQPVTLAKLKEHLNEWAAQKSDPPTRPLAINSWTSGSSPWFNLIYGPDVESPDDYWQNIFATEIRYAQSADSFQEMIVSSAIRGMSPVTLSVAPWYDGVPLFSSLWRKTAEVNSYPQWSVYREIDRHTMEERLSAAVAKGGIVRDLVAYHKGDALNFAAIIDNLPPAVRETYLPGQPVSPPRTTTTTTTTLSCPPTTTASSWTTTTKTTTTTTTTTRATTTTARTTTKPITTTTSTTTTTKTTTTEDGWFRVTGLPIFKRPGA